MTFSNPDGSDFLGRLKIVTKKLLGNVPTTTTRLIAEVTDGQKIVASKTTEDFRGDSTAAGDLLRRTVSTYSLRGTKKWDFTMVHAVSEAGSTANGGIGPLVLSNRVFEQYQDLSLGLTGGESGAARLVKRISGYQSGAPERTGLS